LEVRMCNLIWRNKPEMEGGATRRLSVPHFALGDLAESYSD